MLKNWLFTHKNKDPKDFFDSVLEFLVINNLEEQDKIKGYDWKEIINFEHINKLSFPNDYKLFLNYFAKGRMRFFGGSTYTLENMPYASEVAQEILDDDNAELPRDSIIISQWQGYNFQYLETGVEEPKIGLYMETSGIRKEESIKDWIKNMVRAHIAEMEVQGSLSKRQADALHTRLHKIQ